MDPLGLQDGTLYWYQNSSGQNTGWAGIFVSPQIGLPPGFFGGGRGYLTGLAMHQTPTDPPNDRGNSSGA